MAIEWQTERQYDEILYETYNGIAKSPLTVRTYIMPLHQRP